ncbi:MAG: diguanylate cyclase [Caulobacteraceae bacterium]|nr:diguanylate cyclase [Caulobacteraceae bacterium]
MAIHARILIVARSDVRAGPLAVGLDSLGWRTVTARGPFAAIATLADLEIEAAIVDLADVGPDALAYARRLKAACAPRRMPVVALAHPDPALAAHGFDLAMAHPAHPAQTAMRLETLVRMAVAEEEFELRLETFAERGRRLETPEAEGGPLRVLCIGEPAPQFLALSNALAGHQAQVVGAFTSYTAFDYLHERAFDAVALWAGENQQEALSIVAGMRRNTRLYHIPALLYQRGLADLPAADAFDKGVTDVASQEVSEADTAKRVLELGRSYRRQNAIRHALDKARSSGLMDASTGLFTRDLFASHLVRLTAAGRARNRPLSVCVLRLAERPDTVAARSGGWLDKAIPQIGTMIGRLVRAEDTAARLGPEIFALALPGTRAAAASLAAERIAAVIACTAFEAGPNRPPFVAEFDIGVAEVGPMESAARALEIAAERSLPRQAS